MRDFFYWALFRSDSFFFMFKTLKWRWDFLMAFPEAKTMTFFMRHIHSFFCLSWPFWEFAIDCLVQPQKLGAIKILQDFAFGFTWERLTRTLIHYQNIHATIMRIFQDQLSNLLLLNLFVSFHSLLHLFNNLFESPFIYQYQTCYQIIINLFFLLFWLCCWLQE